MKYRCVYVDASCRYEDVPVCLYSPVTTHKGAKLISKAYSQVWGFTTWIEEV